VSALAPEESSSESDARRKFSPSERLLRHADFERVYQEGRRHFSPHMTVFYMRRDSGAGLRVGFTVSRALGGAVDRNRMKRRLREAVRLRRPTESPPVDVVINPKRSLLTADFDGILKEMTRAFQIIEQKSSRTT
jgi:ribonuclease P protein component